MVKESLESYKDQVRDGFARQEKSLEDHKKEIRDDFDRQQRSIDALTQVVSQGAAPLTNRVSILEEKINASARMLGVIGTATVTMLFTLIGALVINFFHLGGK